MSIVHVQPVQSHVTHATVNICAYMAAFVVAILKFLYFWSRGPYIFIFTGPRKLLVAYLAGSIKARKHLLLFVVAVVSLNLSTDGLSQALLSMGFPAQDDLGVPHFLLQIWLRSTYISCLGSTGSLTAVSPG